MENIMKYILYLKKLATAIIIRVHTLLNEMCLIKFQKTFSLTLYKMRRAKFFFNKFNDASKCNYSFLFSTDPKPPSFIMGSTNLNILYSFLKANIFSISKIPLIKEEILPKRLNFKYTF